MSVPVISNDFAEVLDLGLPGGALHTAGHANSTWRHHIGQMARDVQDWRFAGMHGSFREFHGVVGRQIILAGEIRCDDVAWAAILNQRDLWQADAGMLTYVDDASASYEYCDLQSFEIAERRRIRGPSSSLWWFAPYKIELRQLVP